MLPNESNISETENQKMESSVERNMLTIFYCEN